MPATPPFAATARNSSSVRFRGWSFCAALPVCVKATGFFECRIASAAVRRPQWLRSTRMPRSFIRSTASKPVLLRPAFAGLEASVTEEIPAVVGRLNDTKPESIQLVEPAEIGFERDAVLEPIDDSRPPGLLRLGDVRRLSYPANDVRMPVDLAFHRADADHGLRECGIRWRRTDRKNRLVDTGDPRNTDVLDEGVRERSVRRSRRIPETAQAVDDDGIPIGRFRIRDCGLVQRKCNRGCSTA